ncbi:MAG: hypothetical protein HY216_00910 [Candidatus Rokubacteria bacterium]|nr:hypothetical protein [Candidatus Rokubacteria bacterium]
MDKQPLDLPLEWSHGTHSVSYEEVALRKDQGDFATHCLQRSATYMMAMTVRDAIRVAVTDPKTSNDPDVRSAYQISRFIRNAFAHSPFDPVWSIDGDCQGKTFEIAGVIKLDTTGLNATRFDWRHYGGPLALFRLSRFVRANILGESPTRRTVVPLPKNVCIQQGDLILERKGLPRD